MRMVSALILAPFLVLAFGKHGDDLEPNHFDAVRLEVTLHAISVRASAAILTEDAAGVLVWRQAGAAGWHESRAVSSKVSRRSHKEIGTDTDFGPVTANLLWTPLTNGMWKVSGSLHNSGQDAVELARFHYLDGTLKDKTNSLQLQGPGNIPALHKSGDLIPPQRSTLENMWARANVKWPRLTDPVHDAANWALSKDIGIFSLGWQERAWGVGFTGPGTAFGEIGYSTSSATRFLVGVLLDNIVLSPGETRVLENVLLWHGDWQQGLASWATQSARELGAHFPRLPVGYCSWYQSENKVTPGEISRATEEFASLAAPPQGRTIQIDDGFQRAPGDWRPNDRFEKTWRVRPAQIKKANLLPGLWLAPAAVFSGNLRVSAHPGWFQRLGSGDFAVSFANWGTTYFLDVDQPDARSFMADVVRKAIQDGWTYLKLDFTYPLSTARVSYDRKKTSFESLRGLYRLFREAAGHNVILSASIGEPGRFVVGYADAARLGGDASPNWTSVVNNFRRLFPLWAVNGRFYEADPDVFYQRSTASQLTADESDLQPCTIGLLGGAMLTSDFPSQWSPKARKQVQGIWSDLGSRSQSSQYGRYQEDGLVRAYRVTYADGLTPQHRVGLYNWADVAQDIRVSFAELGFKRNARLKIAPGSSESQVETDSVVLLSRNQPPHTLRIVALKSQGM
jgi:alpha-galactosidase